jgi:hypothetical protein
MCNEKRRVSFLDLMGSEYCISVGDKIQDFSSNMISWFKNRSLKIRHLKCNKITVDEAAKIESFGSCLLWLSIEDERKQDNEKYFLRNYTYGIRKIGLRETCMIGLVGKCPNLVTLDISWSNKITDKCIAKIVEGCPHIQSLNLSHCIDITDTGIIRLAEGYPNLNSLYLSGGLHHITDLGLVRLTECCPRLHTIDLSNYCNTPGIRFTDTGLIRLSEGCPLLHTIDISGYYNYYNPSLTDTGLIGLSEGCPLLHTISLSGCYSHHHLALSDYQRDVLSYIR